MSIILFDKTICRLLILLIAACCVTLHRHSHKTCHNTTFRASIRLVEP